MIIIGDPTITNYCFAMKNKKKLFFYYASPSIKSFRLHGKFSRSQRIIVVGEELFLISVLRN